MSQGVDGGVGGGKGDGVRMTSSTVHLFIKASVTIFSSLELSVIHNNFQ